MQLRTQTGGQSRTKTFPSDQPRGRSPRPQLCVKAAIVMPEKKAKSTADHFPKWITPAGNGGTVWPAGSSQSERRDLVGARPSEIQFRLAKLPP